MTNDDGLLKKLIEALEQATPGLKAIAEIATALLDEDERTQEANRGETVFDRQEKLAIENARRGNLLLPYAPLERRIG